MLAGTMRRSLSPAALVLAALASGCYLAHERALDDGGGADGGRDAAVRDAGASIDAAPSSCRAVDPLAACLQSGSMPFLTVGAPSEVVLTTGDCHCGGTLVCSAAVTRTAAPGMPGEVALRMDVCDEGRCRACTAPYDVSCTVPAVTAGEYRVTVNGDEPSFDLWAMPGPGVPPTAMCQSVGSSGGGLCDFPGDLTAWRPRVACFPDRVGADRVVLELEAEGTSCALEPGPCDVYVASTPEGGSFEVRPRIRSCDEGGSTWGCTGATGTLRRSCTVTGLAPGRYTIGLQDGTSLGTLDVGAGEDVAPRCRPVP